MSKEKKSKSSIIDNIKSDLSDGLNSITTGFNNGWDLLGQSTNLVLKYSLYTVVVGLVFSFLNMFNPLIGYAVILPISALILYFYHELTSTKLKNYARFGANVVLLSVFLVIIYFLFATGSKYINTDASIISSITSFLAILLFVMFMFMPIYMVRAGSSGIKAIKTSFFFVVHNAMRSLFYIISSVLVISVLSNVPAFVGLVVLTPVVFIILSYSFLIFVYSFWDVCR